MLNLWALPIGLARVPRSTFGAFVRGRRSRNLYRCTIDDALLDRLVDALVRELRLDQRVGRATAGDVAAFVGWSVLALATFVVAVAASLTPIVALQVLALRWSS